MRASPAVGAALLRKDFRRACEIMVCQMHEVPSLQGSSGGSRRGSEWFLGVAVVPGGSRWFLVKGDGMFGLSLDDAWKGG